MSKKETVESEKIRYKYTNDILAFVSLIVFNTVVSYGILTGNELGAGIVSAWVLINLTAAGWVFGADIIEEYRK